MSSKAETGLLWIFPLFKKSVTLQFISTRPTGERLNLVIMKDDCVRCTVGGLKLKPLS